MNRGEEWIDHDGTLRTVSWWDEGKYNPWMPWHTSAHMIWAAPVVLCSIVLLAALVVTFL
jgi:hypothetical protein